MENWLTAEEAAQMLKVSYRTIYRWVESGKLKGEKLGKGMWVIDRASVDALLQQEQEQS